MSHLEESVEEKPDDSQQQHSAQHEGEGEAGDIGPMPLARLEVSNTQRQEEEEEEERGHTAHNK